MNQSEKIIIEQTCVISAISQLLVDKGVFKEDELVLYVEKMREIIYEGLGEKQVL